MKFFKTFLAAVFLVLFCSCESYSQSMRKSVRSTISLLEQSIKDKKTDPVEHLLADDFSVNGFDPIISRSVFSAIVTSFPIKRIRRVRITEVSSDTVYVSCNLVVDMYLGIFSEKVEVTMLRVDDQLQLLGLHLNSGMNVSVKVDGKEVSDQGELCLSNYPFIADDGIVMYYDSSLYDAARVMSERMGKGLDIAQDILGEKVGMVLPLLILDQTAESIQLTQPVIPVFLSHDDADKDTIAGIFLYWVYFHEFTELHLVTVKRMQAQDTRWFRDGLADYIAYKTASALHPPTAQYMRDGRMEAYDEIGRSADLLSWIGTGEKASSRRAAGHTGGSGQYAAAMLFFEDLVEEYGEEIIRQTLEATSQYSRVNSETLLRIMTDLTGEDMRARINRY